MKTLKWIQTMEGPLILLPERVCKVWNHRYADDRIDYDRACHIDDYTGTLEVAGEQALVLGDEPLMTTILQKGTDFLIARWSFGNSRESVDTYLLDLQVDTLSWESNSIIVLKEQPYLLIDASLDYSEVYDSEYLRIHTQTGHYEILTTYYKPDAQTALLLHQLKHLVR